MYVLAGATALLFRALGAFDVPTVDALLICGTGIGSAALAAFVTREHPDLYARLHVTASWLCLDVVLVTWGVAASGGASSPWYLWYLANAGAGAFAAGRRGATWVSLGNAAGYLGLLAVRGEIGFLDRPCLLAVARMAFLHGAALFFVQGVADLVTRRLEIRKLRDEDGRRLADLERLAAALDQRTRELTAANRRIRESDRQKSRFLANVSHELRTPLNSILGFSQVLTTRFSGDLPEKPRRFLGNIHTSGEHLLKVLDDVLDLSKIEAGRMTLGPEPVSPGALVAEAVTAAAGEAAPRGISIESDVPEGLPPLEADPLKLKQVLLNLLANAIHFSADGARVIVSAVRLAREESPLGTETVRFSVRDEGVGIAAEDQATVFDEFRQAHRHARAGGTGLGLALVKSLVGLHGGAVGLTSEPGKGSTFRVDLPVCFRGPRERRPQDSSSGELPVIEVPRVLVIGETGAEAIRAALESEGCLALTAGPGPEAVRLARTLHPAALAVLLEGPASWSLLHRLGEGPESHEAPVILCAVTGSRAAALTADELVFEPPRPDALPSAGNGPHRLLTWSRDAGRGPGGSSRVSVVTSLDEARAACAEHPPEAAWLDLSADREVVTLAAELSLTAAATGNPLLRLHVPHAEAEARVAQRLAALAADEGRDAGAVAALVGTVARRALMKAVTGA